MGEGRRGGQGYRGWDGGEGRGQSGARESDGVNYSVSDYRDVLYHIGTVDNIL